MKVGRITRVKNGKMKRILPIIVIAQFFCTSLWFAGNAVMKNLAISFHLTRDAFGHLTSAVQFGFIIGTLAFALFTISDRFSPSKVFFYSAIVGAVFNLGMILEINNLTSLLFFRFLTGFFLAGIYPVGMKIAADYYGKGLGKSLGFLVGALVLGTAFPHLLVGLKINLPWKMVLLFISVIAVLGGLFMLLFVPDGPHRKSGGKLDLRAWLNVFENKKFRAAAIGYFGHMWELYAFWTFVPFMLLTYWKFHDNVDFNISLLSFFIIGSGGLACVLSGYIPSWLGTKRTAMIFLFLSCLCCLFSPWAIDFEQPIHYIIFLIFWGVVVIADSPLFSTLVAQNAPAEIRGTALTIVNCIGFSITIISIQLLMMLLKEIRDPRVIYFILAIGPIIGLIVLLISRRK